MPGEVVELVYIFPIDITPGLTYIGGHIYGHTRNFIMVTIRVFKLGKSIVKGFILGRLTPVAT
jgi:hypothetical protein